MAAVFKRKRFILDYKILFTKPYKIVENVKKIEMMLEKSIKRWKSWLLTDMGELNGFKMTHCIGTMYKTLGSMAFSSETLLLFTVNCIWTNLRFVFA